MTTTHPEDINKHVRKYILVFVALAALTVVTVAVSSLQLSVAAAVALALFIATVKGSLVASYFMHLISEKRLVVLVLLLTVIFFAALMYLPTADVIGNRSMHMSLKSFHIFFITVAMMLAFGFGVWGFRQFGEHGEGLYLLLGILSGVMGVGLIVYGVQFLKKLKGMEEE